MIRNSLFSTLVLVALATTAVAQQQRPGAPATPRPTPTPAATAPTTAAPAAQATVALPTSKIAIINTSEFMDAKTGILKFTTVVTRLNGEFQRAKDDLTALRTRGETLESEINKLRDAPAGTPIDQPALQTKVDQLEQLKKDMQRKAERSAEHTSEPQSQSNLVCRLLLEKKKKKKKYFFSQKITKDSEEEVSSIDIQQIIKAIIENTE